MVVSRLCCNAKIFSFFNIENMWSLLNFCKQTSFFGVFFESEKLLDPFKDFKTRAFHFFLPLRFSFLSYFFSWNETICKSQRWELSELLYFLLKDFPNSFLDFSSSDGKNVFQKKGFQKREKILFNFSKQNLSFEYSFTSSHKITRNLFIL